MTGQRPRWTRNRIAGLVAGAAVVLVGGYLVLRWSGGRSADATDERLGPPTTAPAAHDDDSSGMSRLREGARQVSEPAAALDTAREALTRVEAELASATSAADQERLARKKQLIVEAIARLEENTER
ncbi:MAG: hypothetical protein JXB32_14155 [Deltaproteobacteria bacterium]|nr:hypothetical protein [Deltaproteobacteria bacterium]